MKWTYTTMLTGYEPVEKVKDYLFVTHVANIIRKRDLVKEVQLNVH